MNSAERKKKFEVGLEHFNVEKFFEAHEFWEEIWLVESEPEKTFLQGLIQVTAAFHHFQRGNPDGTESLLASGIVKLLRFPADHRGLAIGDLRDAGKKWARELGNQSSAKELRFPRLTRARKSDPLAKSRNQKSQSLRPKGRR
jgi:predicted metal-dependent hydrolase